MADDGPAVDRAFPKWTVILAVLCALVLLQAIAGFKILSIEAEKAILAEDKRKFTTYETQIPELEERMTKLLGQVERHEARVAELGKKEKGLATEISRGEAKRDTLAEEIAALGRRLAELTGKDSQLSEAAESLRAILGKLEGAGSRLEGVSEKLPGSQESIADSAERLQRQADEISGFATSIAGVTKKLQDVGVEMSATAGVLEQAKDLVPALRTSSKGIDAEREQMAATGDRLVAVVDGLEKTSKETVGPAAKSLEKSALDAAASSKQLGKNSSSLDTEVEKLSDRDGPLYKAAGAMTDSARSLDDTTERFRAGFQDAVKELGAQVKSLEEERKATADAIKGLDGEVGRTAELLARFAKSLDEIDQSSKKLNGETEEYLGHTAGIVELSKALRSGVSKLDAQGEDFRKQAEETIKRLKDAVTRIDSKLTSLEKKIDREFERLEKKMRQ